MKIEVIYIANHSRCGHEIRKSDYRVKSPEDLKKLIANITERPTILCSFCHEKVIATHFEIIKIEGTSAVSIFGKLELEKLKTLPFPFPEKEG